MSKFNIDGQEYDSKKGANMVNQDGAWKENADGTWSEAIPLPLYTHKWLLLPAYQCQCGIKFRMEGDYRAHYAKKHTDGKKYFRNFTGLHPEPKDGED